MKLHRLFVAACGTLMAVALIAVSVPVVRLCAAEEPAAAVAPNPAAEAKTAAEMKPYTEQIAGTPVHFDLVPIPGGKFAMGSPAGEPGRKEDEGPEHEVEIAPFWMGKCEVTWNEYELFMFSLDIQRRKVENREPNAFDKLADAVTRPTKPYTDMTFGMGKEGYPVICMTQLSAKKYCDWLSAKTGHYYRLPTEAEWEYACRAGSKTAYSFGDSPDALDDFAWYYDNSNEAYHPVGKKKTNAWGLHDMHGNVAEWCVDQYTPDVYAKSAGGLASNPLVVATKVEPRSVRGGSWDDDPAALRSAARRGSTKEWKQQDPQIPQSIWYYTDALFLGFRVVRPLVEPTAEEKVKYSADASQQ